MQIARAALDVHAAHYAEAWPKHFAKFTHERPGSSSKQNEIEYSPLVQDYGEFSQPFQLFWSQHQRSGPLICEDHLNSMSVPITIKAGAESISITAASQSI